MIIPDVRSEHLSTWCIAVLHICVLFLIRASPLGSPLPMMSLTGCTATFHLHGLNVGTSLLATSLFGLLHCP
jgi:hypothetical protein